MLQLGGLSPFGGHADGGKLTIIKAGPGFHEEKHFEIGPDGQMIEVHPEAQMQDARKLSLSYSHFPQYAQYALAVNHANPMDAHFNSDDVEMIPEEREEDVVPSAPLSVEFEVKAPVMDVRGLEEQQPELAKDDAKPEERKTADEFNSLPYLSVLRNTVEENDRLFSEKILQKYRALAEQEYLDNNSCSSRNL